MEIIERLDGQEASVYVTEKTLSDHSKVYNVHIKQDDQEIILSCLSELDAQCKAISIHNNL